MRKPLTILFSAVLALAMLPASAFAAPLAAQAGDNIAEGTWGTCPWEISADGVLTVHPGTGADTNGASPWEEYKEDVIKVVFKAENGGKVIAPADCSSLVGVTGSKVSSIDLSGLDTSRTTDMGVMFQYCNDLTSLDTSPLDTSNVTNMNMMFYRCESLTSLDLSSFDTSNVEYMGMMFCLCSSLTSVNLSSFDTSSVMHVGMMFGACSSLESLDLSSFDMRNAGDMGQMFTGCSSLTSLDLSSIDTSNMDGTKMGDVFYECTSLANVKVGSKTLANLDLPFDADWYSKAAGAWFTSAQISTQRKDVADTYVRFDKAAPAPKIVEGGDIVWKSGDGKAALIRSDAAFYLLVRVEVDGTTLDPANYTAREGSTVIELKPEYLSTLSAGEHTVGVVSANGAATAKLTIEGTTDPNPVGTQAMYRLYNPNSGEHFYTASTIERDSVIAAGWNDEGIGWTAPTEGIQVYRLYNSYAGEHHYTTSAEERDMLVSVGWTWEEGGWFSDVDESVPLYRAYNPNAFANNHHYTTDRGEFVTLLGLGWQDEGIGWHGVR